MKKLTRRSFIKLGAAGTTAFAFSGGLPSLAYGKELKEGGEDFSYITGKKRTRVPSACWQCVSRCPMVGYIEDGQIVKIEGNPDSIRAKGKICSKGQAGINQAYNPDRLLYPLKRVGRRGEGKWKRITWDEALDELCGRLKQLRDKGKPEKFMFHYGRMKGSSSKIIKDYFLPAYGTKTIGNHTSICEGAKWTAQELTWGKHNDTNDIENSKFVINFGCNFFEAHTSHIPFATRAINSLTDRDMKLVTFDVRLSNTAAMSNEWIPIRPGTDGAVVLAMANVLMNEDLYDEEFINTWTNVTPLQLKDHLSKYTPQWAEGISGVKAEKIKQLAIFYATIKPSTIVSYRGAVAHYNGVETERAIMMLEAINGNIDVKGGRCISVNAKWKNSFKKPEGHPKKLKIIDGFEGQVALPTHHVSNQVLKMIKDGKHGRPEVYMTYCYNPAYVNGECKENIEILKDETLIPYLVAADVALSETAVLADLVLPDASYLERWDWEDMVSYSLIPEYYIRQPLIKPLGEARNFVDVACDIAKRLGLDLGFGSAEEFVKDACEHTEHVKNAGGFEYMKEHGAWHDKNVNPEYLKYAKKLKDKDLEGTVVDEKTAVIWGGKTGEDYTTTKNAYKKYVGQIIKGVAYKGFKPDKLNKSGKFEIYSNFMKEKGFDPLPAYIPIPEHKDAKPDELILTTYKVVVHSHSRTQNCKWLTEIFHDNPMLIHPETAKKRGIRQDDKVRVTSPIGEIVTKANITSGVHPEVVSIAFHCGHWAYGEIASGEEAANHICEPDCHYIWWKDNGVHPNWIIANAPDPVAGQLRFMDTVVKVEKV